MAYNPSAWTEFAAGIVAASSALAGLVFVALSINVEGIIGMPGVPALALEGITVLTTVLIAAIVLLTPGQSGSWLAAELIVIGLGHSLMVGVLAYRTYFAALPEFRTKRIQMALISLVPGALVGVAGIGLATNSIGGLYWLVPASVLGMLAGITNAWVLLIEIKR